MDSEAASRADAMAYKLRKEAFVSNLSGSSHLDINLVTLVAPVSWPSHASERYQKLTCLVSNTAVHSIVKTRNIEGSGRYSDLCDRFPPQRLYYTICIHSLRVYADFLERRVDCASRSTTTASSTEFKNED